MSGKKEKPAAAPDVVLLGPCQIPRKWLESFGPGQGVEYTQNGVVLTSERQKHTIVIGDTPATVTLSLYVTREPIGQEEVNAVAAVKTTRTADKKAKELEAAEQLAKEKRIMFELGSQSSGEAIMGTLKNIGPLLNAAQVLKKAFPEA